MITTGREYKPEGDDAKERNIRKRRVCYLTAGEPTPEQKGLIDKIERGVVDGKWNSPNPYHVMRCAEIKGIDFYEEELRKDGKWHRVPIDDAEKAIMQTGAS